MKIMFGTALAFALVGVSLAQAQAPQGAPGGPGRAGGGPGGARAPEVVYPSMPIELAVAAAKAAVSACAGSNVGVAILDQAGKAKLIYLTDGASGSHGTRALGKASAALLINAPSEGLNDHAASDPAIADKVKADKEGPRVLMGMAGGLPVVVNGQGMGAIGVSGAEPSSKDGECAAAGLKAVQSQLK